MGLESVELVLAWEEAFDIAIADEDAEKLITPKHACDLIERELALVGREVSRSEIEAQVEAITIEQLGITAEEFRWDARFVEDFRID